MTKPRKLTLGTGLAAGFCLALGAWCEGPAAGLLGWAGLGCGLASFAYYANRPGIYGKREGRLVGWLALPTAAFLVALGTSYALMRLWRQHPTKTLVAPGVWVAGRIGVRDLPEDLAFVVDLVAEFSEPRAIRELAGYRFLPVMDGHFPPDEAAVLALVEGLADPDATVLVHCDSGIGRAPTFAALLLLQRGEADDPEGALARIEAARPFVHVGRADRDFLRRVAPRLQRVARL